MTVQFPIFPDGASFSPDNRMLVNNRQIITRVPKAADEASLLNFESANFSTPSSKLPQSQRQRYASVKRSLGGQMVSNTGDQNAQSGYAVDTYKHSFKKTVAEESKEKAQRYLRDNQPKPLKGYVSPLERKREQRGFIKAEEKPRITEERMQEYQKRKAAVNVSDKVSFDDTAHLNLRPDNKENDRDLFSRKTSDYFQKKRSSLFERGN